MDADLILDAVDVADEVFPTSVSLEVVETAPPVPDTFMDKPFDDYTVTEGLLLIIVLLLLLSQVIRILKEGFHWL